ncbi:scavenger receptor class B member 1-like [Megalops cyprinoides]|uniref:scavenger receptor class B member 1-like n=1 Tax=Megalops cyprinoides TaxID=118141 RepID=UPI0018641733|nr:scavenger receptor class B member 1-like [Megalops cyprinoides]
MPIVWLEESAFIDGPVLTTFRTALVVLPAMMKCVQYILIGLGVGSILVAIILHLRKKKSASEKATLLLPDTDQSNSTSERASLLQDTAD